MNRRETILVSLVAILLVLVGGRMAVRWIGGLKQDRRKQLAAVQRQLRDCRIDLARAEQAAAKLAAWQHRSLPANRSLAQGLYKQWILDALSKSGFTDVNVTTTTTAASRAGSRQPIDLTITGRATLEQLTKFLYTFYHANYLHKIQSFSIAPVQGSGQLDLRFAVEALALKGADRLDTLSSEPSTRLAHGDLDNYVKTIAGRNMLAKAAPDKPDANQATAATKKNLFVTGVLQNGTDSQVWLNLRTTGRLFVLRPGDHFEVENLRGTIDAIHLHPREVVIAIGDRKLRVPLGSNLSDATGQ